MEESGQTRAARISAGFSDYEEAKALGILDEGCWREEEHRDLRTYKPGWGLYRILPGTL